jgi:hypothetical protein
MSLDGRTIGVETLRADQLRQVSSSAVRTSASAPSPDLVHAAGMPSPTSTAKTGWSGRPRRRVRSPSASAGPDGRGRLSALRFRHIVVLEQKLRFRASMPTRAGTRMAKEEGAAAPPLSLPQEIHR